MYRAMEYPRLVKSVSPMLWMSALKKEEKESLLLVAIEAQGILTQVLIMKGMTQ